MTLLDLFSGIGGFHRGLELAGFHFDEVYYSDVDEYANKVYQKNFPDAEPLGDVTKIDQSILDKIKPDIITAGFPCQDISIAGQQRGLENEHGEQTRSGLFHEIIRIMGLCRPRVVILENVANILSNAGWMGTILGELTKVGYACEWQIISASDIGAQHLRKRFWLVAYEGVI